MGGVVAPQYVCQQPTYQGRDRKQPSRRFRFKTHTADSGIERVSMWSDRVLVQVYQKLPVSKP